MTIRKLPTGLFLAAGGVLLANASVNPPLEVPRNETLTFGVGTNNCRAVVHGTVNFIHEITSARPTWLVLDDEAAAWKYARIDLGPDEGDVGRLNVKYGLVAGNLGGQAMCGFYVGANGGGNQARLSLADWGEASTYFTTFELSANAKTSSDAFDALALTAHGAYFRSTNMANLNSKPLRVTFSNSTGSTPYPKIGGFWDSSYFKLPNAGGDVILKGSGSTSPIYFYSQQTDYRLFDVSTAPKGFLRTEGPCDAWFECGAAGKTITINATNVVWGHQGDFYIQGIGGVKTTCSDVLPYGRKTGIVRVVGDADASKRRPFLDLDGTMQYVNSIKLVNGGILTNSSEKVATVVFGRGDAECYVAGTFNTPKIEYRKEGSGALRLLGGSFPSLSVVGGSLVVQAPVHVGTLALTNVTVSCLEGGNLTYDTLQAGAGVVHPLVSAETNVVANVRNIVRGVTIEKTGNGFLTCLTPNDARRSPLVVRAGVLRFGGAVCTNAWWRYVVRRAMVASKTYETSQVPDFSCNLNLGLGSIGMFTPSGCSCVGWLGNAAVGTDAHNLTEGQIVSARPTMNWSTAIFRDLYKTSASDPVLNGGSATDGATVWASLDNSLLDANYYDVASKSSATCKISTWANGVLYTNGVIRADDPATWETITWRLRSSWNQAGAASYALRRIVNNDGKDVPHPTDWTLESSADGVTWETMDVRSNQTFTTSGSAACSLDSQFNYTYNAHIPYLFSAKNANWRFDTFGPVRVCAGATLDLDEIPIDNIAFNGLTVDLAAGAGTITKFAPAGTGALYLENVDESQLEHAFDLPLTLGSVADVSALSRWTVYANGQPLRFARVSYVAARRVLRVSPGLGFMMIVQ